MKDVEEISGREKSMERRLTEAQWWAVFNRLFPDGLADVSSLQELSPSGWDRSPFVRVYHPTVEQIYAESVQIHANRTPVSVEEITIPEEFRRVMG